MSNYWLADGEARVLGPVGLGVVRDLALKGKLKDVRAVSRDGVHFVALAEVPELLQALTAAPLKEDQAMAQGKATEQIREWLQAIANRETHQVFKVNKDASLSAYRAAFFALVHRYVPSRLPPDATPELRLACEDAFLALSGRMVDVERERRAAVASQVTASPAALVPPSVAPVALASSAPATPVTQQPALNLATLAKVRWKGGMVYVRLTLPRGEARPFTSHPEFNWKNDSVVVTSEERVMVGTPAEVTIAFEGHVTQLNTQGRVLGIQPQVTGGFAIRMLDMIEEQRSMIRTWVQRSLG